MKIGAHHLESRQKVSHKVYRDLETEKCKTENAVFEKSVTLLSVQRNIVDKFSFSHPDTDVCLHKKRRNEKTTLTFSFSLYHLSPIFPPV